MISGEEELEAIVDRVIEANPREVRRYHAGRKQLMKYFMGRVMKESGGKADPSAAARILRRRLGG